MRSEGVDAIILAGGLGTRLRPVVDDRPKPLAAIAGHPFLEYLLARLERAGTRRIVLATGYGADQIEAFLETRRRTGTPIHVSRETVPLGTGGALRNALPSTESETLLVLNGDSYLEVDLDRLLRVHAERGGAVTMALARVDDGSRYGAVRADAEGRVLDFVEKGAGSGGGWINGGVYAMQREVVAGIPADTPCSLEREVFPALVGRGLYAEPADGFFLDIGTPDDYRRAQKEFMRRIAPC